MIEITNQDFSEIGIDGQTLTFALYYTVRPKPLPNWRMTLKFILFVLLLLYGASINLAVVLSGGIRAFHTKKKINK